ncbi:MAG TPA: F0F1 ATP synthase subunit epsilon [Candidatus Hydrogenedens sp.]|nr:F0F1 ATP synthase subunit epsilon [Candidatus Hydrogenedens sp.]
MSDRKFLFELFALNMETVNLEAVSVSLPIKYGVITVLPGHTPLITSLEMGIVLIKQENGEKKLIAVMGGIAQITQNKVEIYTNAYEEGLIPEGKEDFSEWKKEITYEKKQDEEKIRFYLLKTIKKWKETHRIGSITGS